MKKILISTLIVILAIPMFGYAASFDCNAELNSIEKFICSDPKLSELESQVSISYKNLYENAIDKEALKNSQLNFLKNKRNSCPDIDCLVKVYEDRATELKDPQNIVKNITPNIVKNSSASVKKIFKITKGDQYEVCQVFNNYLNSQYYHQGDCFIKNYPMDKRLRSPELTEVDVNKYENQQVLAWSMGKSKQEKIEVREHLRSLNASGLHGLWAATVDIDNDHSTDNILINKVYRSAVSSPPPKCDSMGGNIDLIINDRIDNARWNDTLSGQPIIFDGKTFLLFSGFQIYEPRVLRSDENYEDIHHQGNLHLNFVCNLESS